MRFLKGKLFSNTVSNEKFPILPMRVIVSARGKVPFAEFTGELPYPSMLGNMIDESILKFKGFAADFAAKGLFIRVLHS
jgi:hypothetical protein